MATGRDVLSRFFPYAISISSHCRGSSLFIPLDSSSDMDGFRPSSVETTLMCDLVSHALTELQQKFLQMLYDI